MCPLDTKIDDRVKMISSVMENIIEELRGPSFTVEQIDFLITIFTDGLLSCEELNMPPFQAVLDMTVLLDVLKKRAVKT